MKSEAVIAFCQADCLLLTKSVYHRPMQKLLSLRSLWDFCGGIVNSHALRHCPYALHNEVVSQDRAFGEHIRHRRDKAKRE